MLIDITILVLAIIAFYFGFKRGLVSSILFFVAMFVALIAALKLSHWYAVKFEQWFNIASEYLPLLTFAIVFIIVMVLFTLLSRLIESFFSAVNLGFINRLAGACLLYTSDAADDRS